MAKKKLMIYNYQHNCQILLEYKNLLKEHELVAIIIAAPLNNDLDVKLLSGDHGSKVSVFYDYVSATENVDYDIIYFNFDEETPGNFDDILTKMVANKKTNLISEQLEYHLIKTNTTMMQGINYSVVDRVHNLSEQEYAIHYSMQLFQVPIICVYSTGTLTKQLELQLELQCRLEDDGYHVKQISNDVHAGFFEFHLYPEFFMKPETRFLTQIYGINQFIKEIETDDTDVIIVGVPGAILPINDKNNNEFGYHSIIISQAIPCDIGFLSTYIDSFNASYFAELSNLMKYKYNIDLVYFNISDTYMICNNLDRGIPTYLKLDAEGCKELLAKSDINILDNSTFHACSVNDKETVNKIYNQIIDELSQSLEII